MKYRILGIFLAVFLLSACSPKDDSNHSNSDGEKLELIEVKVKLSPDKINANDEVKIEATVTQGDEWVADAKEVKFEIWKNDQEEHEMLQASNEGKGKYSITKTFTEDGQYFVTTHVTARGLHAMPKTDVTVGELTTTGDKVENADSVNHGEEHHHGAELSIELNKKNEFTANKEEVLSAVIKQNEAALSGANITFEVWAMEEDKPQWIDAKEEGNGVYSAPITFPKAGAYHAQVHVKKDELHDHKVFMFDVK